MKSETTGRAGLNGAQELARAKGEESFEDVCVRVKFVSVCALPVLSHSDAISMPFVHPRREAANSRRAFARPSIYFRFCFDAQRSMPTATGNPLFSFASCNRYNIDEGK